jgi:hypothetical protein
MPPRIRYSDAVTVACKALNHAYDPQATSTFREHSAYYGWVWVQYDECVRDCGRVRIKILPEGGGRALRTYYRSDNPEYDTSMPRADAVAEHQRLTFEATAREIAAAQASA